MQKINKWPIEDCGCILCWWKVSRKDCWMEMIRQKLKQQKEKIQDEKLNSVQKNFIVHIFIKRLQLTTVESLMFDVASI